jgi:hypothetical protein
MLERNALLPSYILWIETVIFSETLVNTYKSTQHHKSEAHPQLMKELLASPAVLYKTRLNKVRASCVSNLRSVGLVIIPFGALL